MTPAGMDHIVQTAIISPQAGQNQEHDGGVS